MLASDTNARRQQEHRVTPRKYARERRSLREAATSYILALRLSASVALTYLPWEVADDPDPIVRVTVQPSVHGFDPRELVPLDGGIGVVTLPRSASMMRETVEFSRN
jgi:hypothetical protein